MKTSRFHILPILAAAIMAGGCSDKDPKDDGRNSNELTVKASKEAILSQDDWKAQEQIKVVCDDELYTFETAAGGATAEFKDVEGLLTPSMAADNPVSAYYNCTSMYGTFRVQTEQTVTGGVNLSKIPMYAYTMNQPENNALTLTFKPLVSVLELTIQPKNLSISKLTLAPADNATLANGAIAGEFTVNAAQSSVTANNGINSIDLMFSTDLDLSAGAKLRIPMGWFSIDGGFALTFHYGTSEYTGSVWSDAGLVKTYNEVNGYKQARMMYATFAFDDDAFPRDYYVKTGAKASDKGLSWDAPAALDYALRSAMPGSTIHIAAGTYSPVSLLTGAEESDKARTFEISRNISIIGGYPANAASGALADAAANETILDGNEINYHTVVIAAPKYDGEKVSVKGLTIKGGKSTADDTAGVELNEATLSNNYGAGVAVVGTAVEFDECVIAENNGCNASGLFAVRSDISLTACKIKDNTSEGNGAGAWITSGSDITMTNCSVTENKTTGTSIVAGLYLYVPEGESLKARISGCDISDNQSAANAGGVYVRDDSGSNLLDAKFENCTIKNNTGAMGAAFLGLNANVTLTGCTLSGNVGTNNGIIYFNTTGSANSSLTMDKCTVNGNSNTGTAVASGIYLYNAGGKIDAVVTNSTFSGNTAKGRGGAIYARNNQTGDVNVYCANTTFAGNQSGSYGGAIAMYGAATKKVNVYLYSCTMTGNTDVHATALGGGVGLETAGLTLKTYNTIISGNIANETANDVFVKADVTATVEHANSIIGSQLYNASGTASATSPTFTASTMISSLANNGGTTQTCKLIGNASTNPAVGNGMTATKLKSLANTAVPADVLAADQTGAARGDTAPVMGACVK